MKFITCLNGEVAMVDDEDFERLSPYKWWVTVDSGYVVRAVGGGQVVYMHKDVMNSPFDGKFDHKDQNRLNNQKGNLRPATQSQNMCNRGKMVTNKSGFKGVSYDKFNRKWRAVIMLDYKQKNLGRFNSPVEAAVAYDEAALQYHKEFACLNFPVSTEPTNLNVADLVCQ